MPITKGPSPGRTACGRTASGVAASPFRSELPVELPEVGSVAVPGEDEQSAVDRPARPVAVVTDSSATLPDEMYCAAPVTIVPLRVLAGDQMADDDDPELAAVLEAAAERDERLSTARPAPDRFAAAYRAAAAEGAAAVLSVHLSGLLSGTVSAAALAAASAPIPVRVLDGRGIGTGLGLVVLAATAAARAGYGLDDVAAMAIRRAEGVASYFAVDQPDALLAGGRMVRDPRGPSAAVVGAGDPPGVPDVPALQAAPG